jgi:hypothetical protein
MAPASLSVLRSLPLVVFRSSFFVLLRLGRARLINQPIIWLRRAKAPLLPIDRLGQAGGQEDQTAHHPPSRTATALIASRPSTWPFSLTHDRTRTQLAHTQKGEEDTSNVDKEFMERPAIDSFDFSAIDGYPTTS